MDIAVMGGSSHIAKNLIVRFAALGGCRLTLFCRDRAPVEEFVRRYAPGGEIAVVEGYGDFMERRFDALIDCVGAGAPGTAGFSPVNWFDTLQKFDDLALEYLQKSNPRARLISFSSGAVYGARTPGPFDDGSLYQVAVNAPETGDLYALSRLYAEAKHRAHRDLDIADLRIFAFYSRFVRTDAGYFMSDLLRALREKRELVTTPHDMIRDYIAPDDLFGIVRFCLSHDRVNGAFDVRSLKPAGKFEILERFKTRFGLRWRFSGDAVAASPNGDKPVYCSHSTALERLGFRPRLSALEGLIRETESALDE
ncbi:MAG: NAD(P)-dependent oxidoreductase [Lentisphaeria bacterium]|nr:NAD(P)-dependent oxidoreductase [Lentisphaeria bacterium]